MEKRRTISVISMMFILLMIIRAMEIVFVKTDQTWVGENILHKICCILLIGIALGMSTFFLSYAAEFIVLFVMGNTRLCNFILQIFHLHRHIQMAVPC